MNSATTSSSPRSQPLRSAYISTVIAVHEASAVASSSVGFGPASLPPSVSGSSAISCVAAVDLDIVGIARGGGGRPRGGRRCPRPQLAVPAGEQLRVVDVGESGHRVGEVVGAIQVAAMTVPDGELLALAQCGDPPLGAADHGAGEVELGGQRRAAGDDELGRQLDPVHVGVDPLLHRGDHLLGDAADAVLEPLGCLGSGRELGAGDEELVLEAEDVGVELGVARGRTASGRRRAPSPPRRRRRRPRCGCLTSACGRRTRARWCRRRPSSCRCGSRLRP